MTIAVCLKCGGFKHGAFNPCPKCGFTPDDDESLTKHLLVTDHYLGRDDLEAISTRVKAGDPIQFPAEMLKAAWVSKAVLEAETKRLKRGCLIVCLALLVFLVVAGVVFLALGL
jgi:hypothetical protein